MADMKNSEAGGYADRVSYARQLLARGHSAEQVEEMLDRYQVLTERRPTALTDPNNDPAFKEVTDHGPAEGTG